jgi:alkanesulfonate monooxygenase SsuD/methylene tetrahydromethanopterin reductase-like flavin-dependent oxidoreductase (luciferase family)
MRYAVNMPTGGVCGDARTVAELAAVAEDAGWDGVFLEDYVVYQGHQDWPTCDPWVALAAVAMSTRRIRLGTEVTPLTRRRPWMVAREAVTLDHLSGGRLVLGVGIGDEREPGFGSFGEVVDTRERGRMLDEALAVIAGLWSGEPFTHRGKHYQVGPVTFLPRPLQRPRIPIWVGGAYPHPGAMRRAARWDGSCLYREAPDGGTAHMSPEDVRALAAFARDRRPAGAPFEIVLGGLQRGEDWQLEREHVREVAEAGATWWVEWIAPANLETMRACIERGPLRADR